jgi:acyl-CoA synthetase (AMP-forming)/AMP-acid ligase II
MRLHEPLDSAARSHPDFPFAISESRLLTYQQAAEKSGQIATALWHAGLRPGDRVALIAKNSIEFALLYFACSKAEVVLVPINFRLATPEFAFILDNSQASAVFAGKEFLAAIDQCRPVLSTLRTFVAWNQTPFGPARPRLINGLLAELSPAPKFHIQTPRILQPCRCIPAV